MRGMGSKALRSALVVLVSVAGVTSAPAQTVPVMVGWDEEMDACGGMGDAARLIEVRAGPGTEYPVVGTIAEGQLIHFCGGEGDWFAAIYPAGGDVDCGVNSPIPKRQPYSGPCMSGWVHSSGVRWLAG